MVFLLFDVLKINGDISVVVSARNSVKVKVSDRNRYITQNGSSPNARGHRLENGWV